jgi:Universal stress protein family
VVDLSLGSPTTSARTSRGTWALYALGAEVVLVHSDGAVSGPAADVAAEVGRLAAHERQGELDRQAAQTIQQLLTGDGAERPGSSRRSGARTWSVPATAYWLSGPYNHHGHAPALAHRQVPAGTVRPVLGLALMSGPPARTLDTIAAEDGYGLLVVGARGAGMSSVLLGSVATKLAARASVPVLIVGDRVRKGRAERTLRSVDRADSHP